MYNSICFYCVTCTLLYLISIISGRLFLWQYIFLLHICATYCYREERFIRSFEYLLAKNETIIVIQFFYLTFLLWNIQTVKKGHASLSQYD